MKKLLLILIPFILCSCASDMAHDTYSNDSTLNIALSGKVLSARQVVVKSKDQTAVTSGAGGLVGGVLGHNITHGTSNNTRAISTVGGALVGGVIGSRFGTHKATEYIIKVDKSQLSKDYYSGSRSMRNSIEAIKATGLITVVQTNSKKSPVHFHNDQEVVVIISPNRTRIIPSS
ncbi:MAG: hypothetical protein DGJ47_000844 [Rickettsiaceae bacterium]